MKDEPTPYDGSIPRIKDADVYVCKACEWRSCVRPEDGKPITCGFNHDPKWELQ